MKTQISRWNDEPGKRRSGIYWQQDRMLTDADLNELVGLAQRRIDEALADVIGSGAPRSDKLGLIENGPLIRRSVVYVDGIRARFEGTLPGTDSFGLLQQADYPELRTTPAGNLWLYADVWDWPVTPLQDHAIADPALHGADTTTRLQTLAQVKWYPSSVSPLTDPRNFARGDAVLTVSLRAGSTARDPCDPCAAEIARDIRVRDFLFRLEVQEVIGLEYAPDRLFLKWSRENAAEQYLQDAAPPEFKGPDWIYEFYSDTTEKYAGIHLPLPFWGRSSALKDGYPDARIDMPNVRRWDGYAALDKIENVWTVTFAKDRGRDIAATFTAPDFTAELEGLLLKLTLDGKKFAVGDYWLATVRESDASVQPASSTPLGITHHYLPLARVSGATVLPLNDEETRRLSFPRLSELTADRIGYNATAQQARWTDVIDDGAISAPLNTQRALDLVVERLESSDLSYVIPGCGTATSPSVRSLFGLASGVSAKTDALLTKLLCDFKASHLPIDKSAAGLPAIFNAPSIGSVQQALSLLATVQASPGREATVGAGGVYATLTDAFTALASAQDISLRLLPGVHSLSGGATVTGKRTIKLTGVGAYASKTTLAGVLQLGAREIILRDLSIVGQGASSVVLQADRVIGQNNAIVRNLAFFTHQWSKAFGASGVDEGIGIAVDSSGNVLVTGYFAGTINFGGTALTATGDKDVFVVKFDSAGNHLWSKRFGGPAGTTAMGLDIAADATGNMVLTGFYMTTIDFGGGALTSTTSLKSLFIAKLDTGGGHLWSKAYPPSVVAQQANSLSLDAAGNVIVTGFFNGTINFGPDSSTLLTAAGNSDMFVVKLNSAGVFQWSKRYGAANFDAGRGVAVDANGNIFLTGEFSGAVDFGGGVLTGQSQDVLVVKLDPTGAHLWSKRIGGATVDVGRYIAVDKSGSLAFTGEFSGTVDFGGGGLTSTGGQDAFVAKLDSNGNFLWARRVGGAVDDVSWGIAFDPTGNVLVTGYYNGTTILDGRPLESFGGLDVFVLKLDSSGNHVWSKGYGASGSDQGNRIVADASGNILITGFFTGTINFGGNNFTSVGGLDIFIAKIFPEPVHAPMVTIRARDPARGTDLVWSQNDMMVTESENLATPQPRWALALATPNIGGAIVDNTIKGRLLLLSDFSFEVSEPLTQETGVTSVGGGAYLTIRGNHIGRITSRYERSAPNLDAFGSLTITDNLITEASNSAIAETITLNKNQFGVVSPVDAVGVMAARQMTVVGNQATNIDANLRTLQANVKDAANGLNVVRVGNPGFQTNPAPVWYFGGVGADQI
jgi:hypothetical protein